MNSIFFSHICQLHKLKFLSLILLLFLLQPSITFAQSDPNAEYKIKNALIGFGVGSRQQGDLESAKNLLTCDITGLSLMVVGGVGLVVTDIAYGYMKAYWGDITTADYWISGSILGAGAIVFITGRIFGIILPDKFKITENVTMSVDCFDKELALNFKIMF